MHTFQIWFATDNYNLQMSLNRAKFHTRLVLLSSAAVALALYLFEHVFYIPDKNKPYAVFLAPRFYGGMNDLSSEVFTQWSGLLIVFGLGLAVIGLGLYLVFIRESLHLGVFVFVSAVVMALSFQLLSPQGFGHLIEQSRSVNNGTIYSIGQILKDPNFVSVNPLEKIQYLFVEFGANNSGYTIPGTTHPPGWFLIVFVIAGIARLISFGSDLNTNLFYWGILVTLINCTIAPIVLSISREIFGKKIGALSGIFLIFSPSALMHFCAMADAIGTVFFALAILQIIRVFNVLDQEMIEAKEINRTIIKKVLSAGVYLVLAAQIAYSLIIPISALLLTTVILIGVLHKKMSQVVIGFLLPYLAYSACEAFLSSGKSFWLTRAFMITKDPIFSDLSVLRPFPLAQIANFEIVFVMGGIFLLPSLILALSALVQSKLSWRVISVKREATKSSFLLYIWGLSTVALMLQSTARLEVERVWHWYLMIGWIFSGSFILSLQQVLGKVTGSEESEEERYSMVFISGVLIFQFICSLILGMSIQDYY